MDFSIHVDPEHFEYLRIQKGSLDRLSGDFPRWLAAYQADLRETYEQIAPWLPARAESTLDVGSGLGGIDILIGRHYRGLADPSGRDLSQEPLINLLDGFDDPPKMRLHRRTFNSMRMARNFHVKNGTNPLAFGCYSPDVRKFDAPFDLIVSFGSWCFHFPPGEYLPTPIITGVNERTVLIVDVRTQKPEWMRHLNQNFDLVTILAKKPKWQRCVFRSRLR